MPTPVSTARQCLTGDAAKALDEAVAVARRRGHAQTTSLHAVTALLSPSSSSLLRDACSRARSAANQLRMLELCFALSLDRLSSSSSHSAAQNQHNSHSAGGSTSSSEENEPPISNALMAAIKRSQANQRRNPPEVFHHHQNPCLGPPSSSSSTSPSSSSSLLSVKVELQPLILSILDDPGVSRVFADAGFRSRDVQMALLRPPPSSLLRFPRARCPPVFLCSFPTGPNANPSRPGFHFPFSGSSVVGGFSDSDDNCRRIGEVLVKKKSRNPLLVGVCAADAVRCFSERVDGRTVALGSAGVIPREVSGLNFLWLEKWVAERSSLPLGEADLRSRMEELGLFVERCPAPGAMINVGDLNWLLGMEFASFVVSELTKMLELHRGRMWLVGSAANYETYMKFLTRFPSVEKDWDLQLLPITSLAPALGGLHPRSHSLMESFVPFGGLFPSASDMKSPFTSKNESMPRCQLCDEKLEQEVAAIMSGCSVPFSDSIEMNMPPWLSNTDMMSTKIQDTPKAKDNGAVLNDIQKKWTDICRRLHPRSQPFPGILDLSFTPDRKQMPIDYVNMSMSTSQQPGGYGERTTTSVDLLKLGMSTPMPPVSESKKEELTIDLSLRMVNLPSKEQNESTVPVLESCLPELNRCSPSNNDAVCGRLPIAALLPPSACSDTVAPSVSLSMRSSSCLNTASSGMAAPGLRVPEKFNLNNSKTLWEALVDKVGRQDEALYGISEAIEHLKSGTERRRGMIPSLKQDLWLNILGPDRAGKKKIAMALAETLFGSKQNLVYVDLSKQDGACSTTVFELGQPMSAYDARLRGKTVEDHIFEEISRRPLVVFLENVDKADLPLQTCLSRAIRTGKFINSHRREISIHNAVFVTTAGALKCSATTEKSCISFPEERIVAAQNFQMRISVGFTSDVVANNGPNVSLSSLSEATKKFGSSDRVFVNKRKLSSTKDLGSSYIPLEKIKRQQRSSTAFLDLNLSAEEVEVNDLNESSDDNDRISENTEAWLEEFFGLVDKTVTLLPFDFDSVAANILAKINHSFQKTIGCHGTLEIDYKVMEQILAAAWLSDGNRAIVDWVDSVLGKCLMEIQGRYSCDLSSHFVLKLVAIEELLREEQVLGVQLPAKIVIG